MRIISSSTDRTAEIKTLYAELADAQTRMCDADETDALFILGQIRQIKKDIRRNYEILRKTENFKGHTNLT